MSPVLQVLSAPVFYALELTPLCNHRCRGCGNVFAPDRTQAAAHMRLPEWQTLIDIIAPHAEVVRLTGGEPTLHPDFDAIVQYIQRLGLRFAVFTNGAWTDPARVLRILARNPQPRTVLISLHGATAGAHEAFTGVAGSFDRVVANIRRAAEAGLPVATNTVLTRANQAELAAIARLSQALGARCAVFARYLGEPVPALALSKPEIAGATRRIDQLRAAGHTVQLGNCIPQCLAPGNSSTGCYAGVAYCTIDPWGNLRPCNHSAVSAGNLFDRSLQDIWHGAAMNQFRRAVAEPCRTCAAFSSCHGGCRAMTLELGIDPLICPEQTPPSLPARPPLRLHPDWQPRLRASLRREPWGLVLMQGARLLPVTFEAETVLDTLNGQTTLRDIHARFGDRALALIGSLACTHMVSFGNRP